MPGECHVTLSFKITTESCPQFTAADHRATALHYIITRVMQHSSVSMAISEQCKFCRRTVADFLVLPAIARGWITQGETMPVTFR